MLSKRKICSSGNRKGYRLLYHYFLQTATASVTATFFD
ncbi:hypothetical protein ABID42_000011 [Arcicella rosea]